MYQFKTGTGFQAVAICLGVLCSITGPSNALECNQTGELTLTCTLATSTMT